MALIIGITGHAGVGKDTAGEYLVRNLPHGVYKASFASNLKDACAVIFNIPREHFDDHEHKNLKDIYWNKSPREIAQLVGTECFRQVFDQDIWIRSLENSIPSDTDYVIVTDVRFQNEYDWIVSQGGVVIYINREGYNGNVGVANHASEAGVEFSAPEVTYYIENNGSKEDLYAALDDFTDWILGE